MPCVVYNHVEFYYRPSAARRYEIGYGHPKTFQTRRTGSGGTRFIASADRNTARARRAALGADCAALGVRTAPPRAPGLSAAHMGRFAASQRRADCHSCDAVRLRLLAGRWAGARLDPRLADPCSECVGARDRSVGAEYPSARKRSATAPREVPAL